MYSLFHKLHLHTYLYIRERLTLWKPHFVNPSCKSTRGREPKRRKKLKKSQAPIITHTTHRGEPSSCTNTSRQCINTIIIYNTTHTFTHTIIFDILFLYVLANFFKLGGHSLYTVWNSYLNATYIYIYYIQHKRHGTIASFCVKKPTENHCHGS